MEISLLEDCKPCSQAFVKGQKSDNLPKSLKKTGDRQSLCQRILFSYSNVFSRFISKGLKATKSSALV